MPVERILLEIKTSRTGEETPEAMMQFLASFVNARKRMFYVYRKPIPLSLEIAVFDQTIHFYVSIPEQFKEFLESQLVTQYPKALVVKAKDYMPRLFEDPAQVSMGQLKLSHGFLFPLKSYDTFKEVDPMTSVIGLLSKAGKDDMMSVQFLLVPVSKGWQSKGHRAIHVKEKDKEGVTITNPYTKVFTEKVKYHGFRVAIRLAMKSTSLEQSKHQLFTIASSFSSFNNPEGNSLILRRPLLWQKKRLMSTMMHRSRFFVPSKQFLNIAEIATMYHFPTMKLATIHNISWHKVILSEPPDNLPISEGLTDEEKKNINFFARTEYKNKEATFGVRSDDRRKHMYIIGKTGSGKSTLIANMVISDMRNGKGLCVVDPHGDLCELILNFIPSFRLNDIVYLDPADREFAFSLNPIEADDHAQKELIVSGIVAIFQKIYQHSWGPRLEYILRNVLMSVINLPNPTLLMVPQMLTDDVYRKKAVAQLTDQILVDFWTKEFEQMHPRLRSEAIAPILNKVGQFVTSPTMRNVIKNPHSTVDLEKMMNEGKIILLNLSQGRLGEDNAALLGAMTITKLQLAAMNRVNTLEGDRKDFYLYVDEFQNFATTSFIKILSEARKYRLNLILANQYIAQIPEEVRAAIFGNAGTMMSFLIGAEDATYMAREFVERFKEEDLLALGNYQAILKLAIDGVTRSSFLCTTLPLPNSRTQNREKAIRNSRDRYTKKITE